MNLKEYIYTEEANGVNLAEFIAEDELKKIGEKVCREYDIDDASCDDWEKRTKPSIELAMQITGGKKNFPFDGASNVKFPLITVAALQFNARAMPGILKGKDVVKCRVIGKDEMINPATGEKVPGLKSGIAERVSKHMSYQLTEEMNGWEADVDKATLVLPIVGEIWKKTYFDAEAKTNVSKLIPSKYIKIHYFDDGSKNRISEDIPMYPNDVRSAILNGSFIDDDYEDGYEDDEKQDPEDDFSPVMFVEQHSWLDLDGDKYLEPYIITIHKKTKKVARIIKRWEEKDVKRTEDDTVYKIIPTEYFTQTVFFPSPDGGSRGLGFGNLLTPINETINTTVNQLIDAGTLHTSNSGFIGKGASLGRGKRGGNMSFKLNEWKEIPVPGEDLRKNIVPLPTKEPSTVLFSLLGLMIDSGKDISSVKDVMAGESPGANTAPTTVMALIEQGLKVFNGIFKRIHRSLKEEYQKLYKLNSIYLPDEEYFRIMDDEHSITKIDYNIAGVDVIPVSDPSDVSDTQRVLKAQQLQSMLGQGYNDQEIRRRLLENYDIADKKKLMLPEEALNQPDPELEFKKEELQFEKDKFLWKQVIDRANVKKVLSHAFKLQEEGEAAREGTQLNRVQQELDFLDKELTRMSDERTQRLAAPTGNEGGSGGGGQVAGGA